MKNTVEKFYKGIRTQMKRNGYVREEDAEILMQLVAYCQYGRSSTGMQIEIQKLLLGL